jgi:4-diphosphocytidyl-2-C-methyl-D-erythritol kinase
VTRAVRVRAFAKINLSLHVLAARPDGYHELRTTFQTLALHDTLTFRSRPGPFHIICDDEACPTDETNLVWRAAERVWASARRRGVPADVVVRIAKRIPIAAGLGGGSSDAAAAIRALSALWRVDLTGARVHRLAAALGADVPFFLDGGTALGLGRGDVLRRRADAPPAWVTLAVPAFGVSTADAYRWFDNDAGVPIPRRAGTPAGPCAANDLEAPVAKRHPEIARLVQALRREGASYAAMSGSGSAVFGVFSRRADASAAARTLASVGRRLIVTRTLDRAGYARLARPIVSNLPRKRSIVYT